MTRTAEEARSIAAEIVRLAKAADPDEYQFATELALADTTNEQDRESAEDLQFRILFWIMAA